MSALVADATNWSNVQVAFVLETTPYAGVYDPTAGDSGSDPCAQSGGNLCEESNGIPLIVHNASQIAASIQLAHPGTNVSFAMVDYFSTITNFDDGDGAKFHVDVNNFTQNATSFGLQANRNFSAAAGNTSSSYVLADGDMGDNILHSSSITALYGTMVTGTLNWSANAHHVIVWVGVTAPLDPNYVQNYYVSPSSAALFVTPNMSAACEPAYNFSSGPSPNCVGWVNSSSNSSVSIAKFAHQATNCQSSLGGTCTIDTIDLYATPTDSMSRGWPTSRTNGGPGGPLVVQNVNQVLTAGCDLANATNGSWDGPSFFTCPNGANGTLNFVGRNTTFSNPKLVDSLREIGFGLTGQLPGAPGRPMFTFVPFGNLSLASNLNAASSCSTPSGNYAGCSVLPTILHRGSVTYLGWNWSAVAGQNVLMPGDRWTASFNVVANGGPYGSVPLAVCTSSACLSAEGGTGTGPTSGVSLLVRGADLATESFPLTFVTVVGPGPLVAAFAVSSPAPVWGEIVQFQASPSGGFAPFLYAWSFGDGSTASTAQVTHSFAAPGTYTVTLTVSDLSGLTATHSQTMVVTSPQLQVQLSMSANVTTEGRPITLGGLATGGFPAYHYTWAGLPPGCSGIDAPSFTCAPSVSGSFAVQLNVLDSAGSGQLSALTLLVNPRPVVAIRYSAAAGCGGPTSPITFWAEELGGTPGYSVTWNFGDHHTAQVDRSVHVFSAPGTYTVTSQITDSVGAVANDTLTLKVVSATHCGGANQPGSSMMTGAETLAIGIAIVVAVAAVVVIAYRRSR